MHSIRWRHWLIAGWLLAPMAFAQQPQTRETRIGFVYPAGGRPGTTFTITVGGQYLEATTNAFVSGTGVRAVVLDQSENLSPKQVNDLRERQDQLRKEKKTPDVTRELLEIAKKLDLYQKRRATPAIGERVTLQITIAPDAEPGDRELRLLSRAGLSNPLVFQVGQLPEFAKQNPPETDLTVRREQRYGEIKAVPPTETAITIPATINGQILQGGVDRFRFTAKQGQSLVIAAAARKLIPYLADAVPGWFQAVLTLYDAQGKELAYDDDYRFHPDPVLFYKIPTDGDYILEIKDSLYRGRDDFVYRITVGELPFVTGIFPLGAKAGGPVQLELRGWNLPFATMSLNIHPTARGYFPFTVRHNNLISQPIPLMVDTLPERFEQEPNNLRPHAQPVTLPVIINGRIHQPGDTDIFRFEGRVGETIVAEIHARRLDSPLDSLLKFLDANGKEIAVNDDYEDKSTGLNTHHADSYLRATLPATSRYYVQITDTQGQGSHDHAYRLRLSTPRPDFALRVVPSSLTVRGSNSTVPLTLFALRQDGYTNAITVTLKDAPKDFTLTGATIPAGADKITATLTVSRSFTNETLNLQLEGRALILNQEVIRPVIPADDMMQAFIYRHLVPAKELKIAFVGRAASSRNASSRSEATPGERLQQLLQAVAPREPVRLPAGGTTRLELKFPPFPRLDQLQFALKDPPEGITIQSAQLTANQTALVLQSDAAKVKPGQKGNLIITVLAPRPNPPATPEKTGRPPLFPAGTLPAIGYEIIAP